MTPARWTLLVIVLLLLGAVTLFTVQNLERTSDLSFDLWVWAGHLKRPQPVPYLLLSAFGLGLILGGGWGLLGRMRSATRMAELEQEVARSSLRSPSSTGSAASDDDPWG